MRITKYEFENDKVAYEYGIEYYKENGYGECPDYETLINLDAIDRIIVCSITTAKKLLKQYGGKAWTEHYDRDGGLIEITNINLKGNNSKFKYSYHL